MLSGSGSHQSGGITGSNSISSASAYGKNKLPY